MTVRYLASLFGFIGIGLLGSFVFVTGNSNAEPAKESGDVSLKTIEYPQLVEAVKRSAAR